MDAPELLESSGACIVLNIVLKSKKFFSKYGNLA